MWRFWRRACFSNGSPMRLGILIALVLLTALTQEGCGGASSNSAKATTDSVKPPADPAAAIGSKGAKSPLGPVRLSYRPQGAETHTYRFTSGQVEKDGTITGFRYTLRVSVTPSQGKEAILVQCERTGSEGVLGGSALSGTEKQGMSAKAEVNARGHVLRLLEVVGNQTPTGDVIISGGKNVLEDSLGLPTTELALGALHACPLPDHPVKVDDAWRTTLAIPLTDGTHTTETVKYEGKLLGLEEADGSTYAVIESRVYFRDIPPYVAHLRFDTKRNLVTLVKWVSVPGADEKPLGRWLELLR